MLSNHMRDLAVAPKGGHCGSESRPSARLAFVCNASVSPLSRQSPTILYFQPSIHPL